jgi:hypothetical protein
MKSVNKFVMVVNKVVIKVSKQVVMKSVNKFVMVCSRVSKQVGKQICSVVDYK